MNCVLSRRHFLGSLALAAAPNAFAAADSAWPVRPVRLVVPGPPGGGTDILARLLAEQLGRSFKQPFIVDNKPGANGLLGSDVVAQAQADGHVLLFSYAGAMVINPGLVARAPDPLKAFEPVAQVGAVGNLLLVTPDLPVRNLSELVAYARQQPKPMAYGTWGTASGGHLAMAAFLRKAGIEMTHVPYKGAAPVTTDLLGGVIKIGWTDVSSPIPYVQAGKLRALAITGTQRVPQFPELATMTEQGFPFSATAWYGVFAPARTPREIVVRINAEIVRIISTTEFRARLYTLNMPAAPTPDVDAFRQIVAEDLKTWRGILQDLNIQPE